MRVIVAHYLKGGTMAAPHEQQWVTLEELMVSTLEMTDAVAKLLIEKGVINDAEFKQTLGEEKLAYLKRIH
jgi:hypothetical protein